MKVDVIHKGSSRESPFVRLSDDRASFFALFLVGQRKNLAVSLLYCSFQSNLVGKSRAQQKEKIYDHSCVDGR